MAPFRCRVTQTIQVRFSEPILAETANNSNLVVSSGATLVAGSWSLSEEQALATFTPATPFKDFAQINLWRQDGCNRSGGAPPAPGGTSFVHHRRFHAPRHYLAQPGARCQGHSHKRRRARASHSEVIVPAQFTTPAIVLRHAGTDVAGRLDYILNNTAVVFTPNAPLASDTAYQVDIVPATDRFGIRQTGGEVYNFETVDLIAPVLRALSAGSSTTMRVGSTAYI